MTIIVFICFVFLLLIGIPLYIALFGLSAYLFTTTDRLPLLSSVISFQKLQSQEFIIAIPLFTFISFILAYSKSPQKIFNIFNKLFSHIKGADIAITLLLMTFFTALTGASGATILALGGLLYPLLIRSKKTPDFSLGLITSSGSIGLLIAPSLPVIIYSLVASQVMSGSLKPDINTLFKVGIVPTILFIGSFFLYSFFTVKQISTRKFNLKEAKKAIISGRYELFIPIIIYGGIYSGSMTVLEAAAVSCFYVFFYVFILRKDIPLKKLPDITLDSMKITGSIFIIMATAFMLTNYIVDQRISDLIFNKLFPYIDNKYSFLLVINILLLIVGSFMDIFSAILIILPILIPIVEKYGINPYHFAMIFLINLEIGYITPPVGMNLFISSHRFRKPILKVYKTTIPFLIIMLFNLALITYIPSISTFLVEDKTGNKNIDFQAPSEIKNITTTNITNSSVTLRFKAVGDDQLKGRASAYKVYYSEFDIETQDDIDFADIYENSIQPKKANKLEKITIDGLTADMEYYITVIALDESGNKSTPSKTIQIKTKK